MPGNVNRLLAPIDVLLIVLGYYFLVPFIDEFFDEYCLRMRFMLFNVLCRPNVSMKLLREYQNVGPKVSRTFKKGCKEM